VCNTVTSLGQIGGLSRRKITEIRLDLQCKFITRPVVFNPRRLPALGNGAEPQEEHRPPQRFTTRRIYL
jgi:hypothetical protein